MHCDVDVSHLIGFAAAREGELTYFHVSRFPAVFSYTLSRHYSIDCIWVNTSNRGYGDRVSPWDIADLVLKKKEERSIILCFTAERFGLSGAQVGDAIL